ncbi:ADP-ribose polymerase [Flavilitoribacter nigricans DSM 23189 = NBRC 102662]|uniref:NAD(+) ADP-ribosyltransferase n=2 Tax=Flavilitoribacter TaxID=2762562 RepID=A0A2D0N4K9_FLAN2|nr:ADP-ribose polymerase [Flavilitoribacter nigricans DSM 23189 = NBRC 102662]
MVKVPTNWQLDQSSPAPAIVDSKPNATEKTPLKTARLIMVSAHNNNKFYEMKEQPDGTFLVAYGRVGTAGTSVSYPMRLWDRKIREKLQKGYLDQTHLFAEEIAHTGLEAIEHPGVRGLMSFLVNAARQSIRHNYQVSAEQVTQVQVDQAQLVLDQLVDLGTKTKVPGEINELLLDLYRIIPRRMRKVQDHLIEALDTEEDRSELDNLLAAEQATLDVMRGQVKMNTQRQEQGTEPTDLLRSMGLSVEPVTEDASIRHIREMMGKDARKFHRAYAVINHHTQRSFDQFLEGAADKETRLFWHGSRNENWLSILGSGLVLRPANAVITGKMFGYGLYFADKCRKSLNYSSLRGSYWSGGTQNRAYLALYDVHIGKPLKIKNHQGWCYELTEENLRKRGNYDSLFAQGGADLINNEYIVYNQAQCTVRYLIELRD